MALSWKGTVYSVPNAVSKTNATATPRGTTCFDNLFPEGSRRVGRGSRGASRKPSVAKPAPLKAKKADAAEPEYYHHEDPHHREEYSSGPSYHRVSVSSFV